MAEIENDASPLAGVDDSLDVREAVQPLKLSPVGELVNELLVTMGASGDNAEENYKHLLAELREQSFEAVIEIARRECACIATDYSTRWTLIYAASALEDRAALPLLKSVVLTPIPPEQSPDPHASTVAEETIIRTTAVDGLAVLAKRGEKDAVDALFECLGIASFSIRRAAVQGLMGSPQGDDLRSRIVDCLPKDQRFLLDLKRLDVRKVPQIDDPRQNLSEKGREDNKPAAPDITDHGRAKQGEISRTPTAGKKPDKRED